MTPTMRRIALLLALAGCAETDVWYYGYFAFMALVIAWWAVDTWGRRRR